MSDPASELPFDELDIGLPTANPIANVYFDAAEALGYTVDILSSHHGVGRIVCGDKFLDVFGRWIGINDITASMLSGNKGYASSELASNGLSVPDAITVERGGEFDIKRVARTMIDAARGRYPICIKPVSGTHGMQVVPDIRDEEELLRVLFEDRSCAAHCSMIESHCVGRHYRVVVAYGEVIGCVERTPPQVTGDGETTLADLVARYNHDRWRWNLVPAELEKRQRFCIRRRHGFEIEDVVPEGITVVLDDRCNLKVGGNIRYVDPESVADGARDACVGAAETFGLEFAGIDLICDDVTDSGGDSWVINEVNSQPAAHVPVPTLTREQRLDWPGRLLQKYLGPV